MASPHHEAYRGGELCHAPGAGQERILSVRERCDDDFANSAASNGWYNDNRFRFFFCFSPFEFRTAALPYQNVPH